MSYDQALADEIRTVLDGEPRMTERRMFGGLSFMIIARVMKGWLQVGTDALNTEATLSAWVRRGVDHARSLPAK